MKETLEGSPRNNFSVRKNFILLLFLTIAAIVILCWFSFVFLAFISGAPIFQDESSLLLDIFMVFVFPFFIGGLAGLLSLIFTALLRQKWWISVPVSILLLGLPLAAYMTTWIASWIARLFYIATPEDAERTKRFLSMSIAPAEEAVDPEVEKMLRLKRLLDNGIITPDEFEAQRQKVVSAGSVSAAAPARPRYFSLWQVVVAAILGGFLAGAALIAINFRRLNHKDQYTGALIVCLVGYFASILISAFAAVVVAGFNPWLIMLIPMVYPVIVYLWHNEAQQPLLRELLTSGRAKNESWWLTLGISFVALVFSFLGAILMAVILVSLFQPALTG